LERTKEITMKHIKYYFKRIWLNIFKRNHLCMITMQRPTLGCIFRGVLPLDNTQYTFEYIGNGLWYSKDKPVKPIFFETLYI
jgi:hypothetical protein